MDPAFTRQRQARLASSLSGTNMSLAGEYNQRIVLQSIRLGGIVTRPELAAATGLTMPTILNITRRLSEIGLIFENGRTEGARGQPAVRMAINPDGCFSLGVNIDRSGLTVLLLDIAGKVRAIRRHLIPYLLPDDVVLRVADSIDQMLAEQPIDRDRIIGMGIAIPDDLGVISFPDRPDAYGIWEETDIVRRFHDIWPGPVHIDNDAAAAAMGEGQFGLGMVHRSFFYILVSAGLGGSLVIDGSHYRGATGRSGELGFLADGTGELQDIVSLSGLNARLREAGIADADDPAGAAVTEDWLAAAAEALVKPLAVINCLINPDAVLIAGGLDKALARRLVAQVKDKLGSLAWRVPFRSPILLAQIYEDAAAIGAAILPFSDQLLPSQASLMKRRI